METIYSIEERPMGVGTPQVSVLKLGPFQSFQVRLREVGACYLKGFRTVGEERSAFTRQGSLVQIQPRPPFSCFMPSNAKRFRLARDRLPYRAKLDYPRIECGLEIRV